MDHNEPYEFNQIMSLLHFQKTIQSKTHYNILGDEFQKY